MVLSSVAFADKSAPWSAEIGAALSAKRFGYREYSDSGRLLDRESGTLPGALLVLRLRRAPWFVEAEGAYHAGAVIYDGQTNLGIPVSSQTDTVLVDGGVRFGRRFDPGEVEITPYAGAALHYWDRDIRPTRTAGGTYVSGLREIYRWYTLEFGVRGAVSTGIEGMRIGLDLRGFRIVQPTMEYGGVGPYDSTTLALGSKYGWRAGLPVEYALDTSMSLRAELYAEGWAFGRSATQNLTSGGVVVGTVTEPRSETRNAGITAGFEYRF